MKQRELREDEITLFKVSNHLYMVIRKDRMVDGEQRFKVGHWNEQTNGYGLNDYNLSFDNAIKRFNSRIRTNLEEKWMKDNLISPLKPLTDWRKYAKDKLSHILELFQEDMLDSEDIEEILKEITE